MAADKRKSAAPQGAGWALQHGKPARLDPYYRWALASAWRSALREVGSGKQGQAPERLRVLVEAPAAQSERQRQRMLQDPRWQVPPIYLQPPRGASLPSRYFTATLAPQALPWLEGNPYGIRWELAAATRDGARLDRAHPMGLFGIERSHQSFRTAQNFGELRSDGPRGQDPASPGVIGVIDFGCPLLNQRFTRGGPHWISAARRGEAPPTRLLALWDQGSELGKGSVPGPWSLPQPMAYGRMLHAGDIDALRRQVWVEGGCDEEEAYRRLDYLIAYEDARRRIWRTTHGAHVLDLAAGNLDPLLGQQARPDRAGNADLVFVQLPSSTAADASGASLGAQLLDGLRYIMEQAAPEKPLVVNISYGTQAGPHDGSSLIEKAFDELLELRGERFAIVLAAGNAAQAGCHLRRRVAADRSALLRLQLAAGDTTDSFVEIWYDARPDQRLELRVCTPELQWSDWLGPGAQQLLPSGEGGLPAAMLSHDAKPPNGDRSLALLALAPTLASLDDRGPLSSAGLWQIELRLRGTEAGAGLMLDAWLERDNPGNLAEAGGRSAFLGQQDDDAEQTLCSLATGRRTLVVGGFRASDGWRPDYVSRGDRGGAAGALMPAVSAVCELDPCRPGLVAAGVRSAESTVMNGTSVAAPVFARRLFNRLSGGQGGKPLAELVGELARRDPHLRLDA